MKDFDIVLVLVFCLSQVIAYSPKMVIMHLNKRGLYVAPLFPASIFGFTATHGILQNNATSFNYKGDKRYSVLRFMESSKNRPTSSEMIWIACMRRVAEDKITLAKHIKCHWNIVYAVRYGGQFTCINCKLDFIWYSRSYVDPMEHHLLTK
jgi:hypothetical protein